jgi:hypothetical protein
MNEPAPIGERVRVRTDLTSAYAGKVGKLVDEVGLGTVQHFLIIDFPDRNNQELHFLPREVEPVEPTERSACWWMLTLLVR